MLDDDDGGRSLRRNGELGDELPAGVQVHEIVIGELFALELLGAGDAGMGAVCIESGRLVGVFAIAKNGRLGDPDAESLGQGL